MSDDVGVAAVVAEVPDVKPLQPDSEGNYVLSKKTLSALLSSVKLTKEPVLASATDVIDDSPVNVACVVFRHLFGFNNKQLNRLCTLSIPTGVGNLELAQWYYESGYWLASLVVAFEAKVLVDGELVDSGEEDIEVARTRLIGFIDKVFSDETKISSKYIKQVLEMVSK